jgi:hypothetical protein
MRIFLNGYPESAHDRRMARSAWCGHCGHRPATNKSGELVLHATDGRETTFIRFACPGSEKLPVWWCEFCGQFIPTRKGIVQEEALYQQHKQRNGALCQGSDKRISAKCPECAYIIPLWTHLRVTPEFEPHGIDGSTSLLKHIFSKPTYCKGGGKKPMFPNQQTSAVAPF